MQDRPSVQETLQLMRAFLSIVRFDKRAEVVALAERLAGQPRARDRVSHDVALPAKDSLNMTLSWSAGMVKSTKAKKLS